MARVLTQRLGKVTARMSGPLYDAVDRLLRTETYLPIVDAMEQEMNVLVLAARQGWPVGLGVFRAKLEAAAGTTSQAKAAMGQTSSGATHSRDRFEITTRVDDDGITVGAVNGAPYAHFITSWKINLSASEIQQVLAAARAERSKDVGRRNLLLRDWYAAKAEAKRDGGADIGSFDSWVGRTPDAAKKRLSAYIDRPKKSAVWQLLRNPQKAATERLVLKIGPLLRNIVEGAARGS